MIRFQNRASNITRIPPVHLDKAVICVLFFFSLPSDFSRLNVASVEIKRKRTKCLLFLVQFVATGHDRYFVLVFYCSVFYVLWKQPPLPDFWSVYLPHWSNTCSTLPLAYSHTHSVPQQIDLFALPKQARPSLIKVPSSWLTPGCCHTSTCRANSGIPATPTWECRP